MDQKCATINIQRPFLRPFTFIFCRQLPFPTFSIILGEAPEKDTNNTALQAIEWNFDNFTNYIN